MTTRKPLNEWAVVPRWWLDKISGTPIAAEMNLKLWEVEGPDLCWPEDAADLMLYRQGVLRGDVT